jgi:pimeloyl-ACP methyl ester carboxylesterase
MGYPAGLHIMARQAAEPGAPAVVLVHGSLDRAESFRRVMRRLRELTIVAYDRRGYQGSREAGVVGLSGHIRDLLAIGRQVRDGGAASVAAVGHSVGGVVVIGAALTDPGSFDSLGAFEPPMPWLGFRRTPPGGDRPRGGAALAEDPAEEVERFFSRMVSRSAWARLSQAGKASRRADGPALLADILTLRGVRPFDVTDLAVPALFGVGGPTSATHHRQGVAWLGAHVPGAAVFEIEGAQHGAHLSHPDRFAAFVRAVVARQPPPSGH